MRQALTLAILLAALPLGGCVAADRGVQREQNEEVKAPRDEISRTRKVLENRPTP